MACNQETEIKSEELCRTCLTKDIELYPIFDVHLSATVTFDYLLTSTTGIQVSRNDGLPTTICWDCKEKASKAYEFKRQSEAANMALRGLLMKENSTSTKDLNQTNAPDVKTEELSSNDDDDYSDGAYDVPICNLPDLHEQEAVKIKEESLERKSCFVCKSCLVVFDTHFKLLEHQKICIRVECDETNRTYCPLCGTCYNGAGNLTKHMWESHADLMGPKKRGRPKKMLTSTILNKLSENGFCITSMPAKKIECSFCKQNFETREELRSHAANHEETKVLCCLVCKKIYLDKKKFDLHGCIEEKAEVNNEENVNVSNTEVINEENVNVSNAEVINEENVNVSNAEVINEENVNVSNAEVINEENVNVSNAEVINEENVNVSNTEVINEENVNVSNAEVINEENVNDSAEQTETEDNPQNNILSEITLRQFLEPSMDMENINMLIVCNACSCILQSEADLISHRDAEHPELSHRCNLCTKVFASLRSAARHRSVCKQIERKHKCNTCGLKFAYEISLNKHILRYHEGESVSVKFIDPKTKREERQFECDTCNRSFYKRDLLVKHTKIHMPIENFYQCDVCEKKFHRSDNLRSHKRVHQLQRDKSASSNCLCLYCGRSFSNSSNLIVHMRRHTGEKPYKCDFCGKGFPRSSDLQCHRRSHTGEKPCVCRVCGKGFSRSNKLSRHMRVHTGQRPYKCTYCEKAFSQSNDLNLHIRRHTGDRPYICDVCGDRFIQGTALQNHRRAHGHFPDQPADAPSEAQALTFTVRNMSHSV